MSHTQPHPIAQPTSLPATELPASKETTGVATKLGPRFVMPIAAFLLCLSLLSLSGCQLFSPKQGRKSPDRFSASESGMNWPREADTMPPKPGSRGEKNWWQRWMNEDNKSTGWSSRARAVEERLGFR